MKTFTEDEKIIARNIDREYQWMARDSDKGLCVYERKPKKEESYWHAGGYDYLSPFSHLFSAVKWEDEEPTLISDIYNPPILNDEEREYIKMITREEILTEAKNCICGEREADYGSPEDNFAKISKLWTIYLEKEISSIDVAVMMCLFKVARMSGPNKGGIDSFVDLAGYAACGGEIFSKLHEISS